MILLYCDHESGESALHPAMINGIEVGPRRYRVVDHFAVIDSAYEAVAMHDAIDLCQHSVYRLATPDEQNRYLDQLEEERRLREEATKPAPPSKKEPARKSNGG